MTPAFARKIKSFAHLSLAVKLLFVEALFTSAYVKFSLVFLPFGKVALWLGTARNIGDDVTQPGNVTVITNITIAIKLCDRYAPWPTECYTRSLTGKIMLKRRQIASTLFFAFRKDAKGSLEGHAWLKSSGRVVTGFCDFSTYMIHSTFS